LGQAPDVDALRRRTEKRRRFRRCSDRARRRRRRGGRDPGLSREPRRPARGAALRIADRRRQKVMRHERCNFDSDGVEIHYLVAGEGELVILLHGFIFSVGPAWVDGGLFDELSRTNHVVAMDLRGHGASGKPRDAKRYGLEMVDDVLRLMDHLGFDDAHVVGYSLGGTLACKCLEVAPDRLRSVVLGGAGWMRKGDGADRGGPPLAEMPDRVRPGEPLSSHFWPNPDARRPREIQDLVDGNDPAALAALARGMLEVTVDEDAL